MPSFIRYAVVSLGLSAGAWSFAAEPARSLNDLTGPWQLFVDDYAVASRENLARRYHPFEKHPANPLVRADKPWEGRCVYVYGTVLPNESGKGFRMWYHALPETQGDDAYRLLYATSNDGLKWDKPNLGLVEYKGSKANNIFIRRGQRDHILSVIHTPWEKDPTHRYLMINFDGDREGDNGYMAAWSPDGLRWTDATPKSVFAKGGDVGQFLRDFHTGKYVGYAKSTANVSGLRRRAVNRTVADSVEKWSEPQLVLAPDTFDDRWAKGIHRTSFYGMSVFAYESMYLGMLWVFQAYDDEGYFDGPIFVELCTSHDGVRWFRQEGDRTPILDVGKPKSWDGGMVTTPQHPLLVDGKLWLYYGGIDGTHAPKVPWNGGVGLATLRKDGFASLDAADKPGTLTTKRLAKAAGKLRVNCRVNAGGSLRVEVLDAAGKPIPGYGRDDCKPLTGDSIDQPVAWSSKTGLPAASPTRLRFTLQNASVYSFRADNPVKVLDEPETAPLAVLYTFENGWNDSLESDGKQAAVQHGEIRIRGDKDTVAFGGAAIPLGSPWCPLNTVEIEETANLGTRFTLAAMVRSSDNRYARLFSSASDQGRIRTDELVFDFDPNGHAVPGLRLVCKGLPVESKPLSFADGKYHHLAATYDDGAIALFLDGAEVGRGAVPAGPPVAMIRNLFVGEDSDFGRDEQLRGNADDILVIGRALAPQQVNTLAKKGAEAFFKTNKAILQPKR